jgi:uncharacterized protein
MRVVIDTNIWISSLSSKSSSHWLVNSFLEERFELIVSTDILLEYEEKLKEKYALHVADDFLEVIGVAVNVKRISSHFQWNLIRDPDDNKFRDCAIASGSDYLVTEDHDFDVLKGIPFPNVTVINLSQFKVILEI